MPKAKVELRDTKIMGKNLRVGDLFEGVEVVEVRLTDAGRVSFMLKNGRWKRRPQGERLSIQRAA